jgi:hypothetical protein
MRRLAPLFLLALTACHHDPPPPPPPPLSDADRAAAKSAIEAQRAAADGDDRARREAVVAARKTKILPGQCPVGAHELLGEYDLYSTMHNSLTVRALGITDLCLDGKPPTGEGPAHKAVADSLRGFETQLPYASAPVAPFLDRIAEVKPPEYSLTLVVDELQQPKMAGESQFIGGKVLGRLYLWSRDKHANICAAPLDGESSERVTVTNSFGLPPAALADSRLLGDLLVPAIARAAERLQPLGK